MLQPKHSPSSIFPLAKSIGLVMVACAIFMLALLPWIQPGDGVHVPTFFLFLGRFHPLILHLPIGWILLATMLEARRLPFMDRIIPEVSESLKTFIVILAASSAFVAVLLGWMLSYGGGYDPGLLSNHFNAGLVTAIAANLALFVRLLPQPALNGVYPLLIVITAGALTLAGHYGASITHGTDYLTEYAPNPIRTALGLPAKADPGKASPPLKVEDRHVFADVITPVLSQNCFTCHGTDTMKGGLRMSDYALLKKGGRSGPAFIPGDADHSELLKRVHLPATDDKHMPPQGRTGMTDNQISILTWWINAGAPEKETIAELKPPAEILQAITSSSGTAPQADEEVSLTGDPVIPVSSGPLPPLPTDIPGLLHSIVPSGTDLEFMDGYRFAEVDDQQVAKLNPVADHIIWLDLSHSPITDGIGSTLEKMPHLQKLLLQNTSVGDPLLDSISHLDELEMLNLNSTKVTDQGLIKLQSLKKLSHIYLWQTPVTDAGEAALKAALPHLEIVRVMAPIPKPAPVLKAPVMPKASPTPNPIGK